MDNKLFASSDSSKRFGFGSKIHFVSKKKNGCINSSYILTNNIDYYYDYYNIKLFIDYYDYYY